MNQLSYMIASHSSLPNIKSLSRSYTSYPFEPKYCYDINSYDPQLKRSINTLPSRPNNYYEASTGNANIASRIDLPESNSNEYSLNNLYSFKVPTIFTASRSYLFTRYTLNDWEKANKIDLLHGNNVRKDSEHIRGQASRLCKEMDEKTIINQSDADKKLGERIDDIEFWVNECKAENGCMINEMNALAKTMGSLEKVITDLANPLNISEECLYSREKRKSIELVHDLVEQQLIKEIDLIKISEKEFKQLLRNANNQQALNRASQHELEKDVDDKNVALFLDNSCHRMRSSSDFIKRYDGANRIDNTFTIPLTWAQFSSNNIRRGRAERQVSIDLRNVIRESVDRIIKSIQNQWNTVNKALVERLNDYHDNRNKIQNNLLKTLQEIKDLEITIKLLKESIENKEIPLQVAQSRMVKRLRRPINEACRDRAQTSLVNGVNQINESVDILCMKLRESENALQKLLQAKLSFEHNLDLKNNAIVIDSEKCLQARQKVSLYSGIYSI